MENFDNFETVKRWTNNLNEGRYQETCLRYLKIFCKAYDVTPDELIQQRIEELKSSNMTVRCKAEDRVMEYYKKLAETATGQAINFYRKICSFYRYNFVRLGTKDPGYTVQREQDYLATAEETKRMCEFLDLEGKTYLLILAESCGRPGAVANITWKDVQEEIYSDKLPMKVWLKHKVKLSRKKYFSFICEDAKESLRILINGRTMKPNEKVFSTGCSGLRKKVMNAAEQIGIYQNGNGKQAFRLHTFRKRGQTTLERKHIPINWVDRMLGHVPRGAQGGTYSLPDVEAMREEYATAMAELTIYNYIQRETVTQGISKEQLCQVLIQLLPEKTEEITKLLT